MSLYITYAHAPCLCFAAIFALGRAYVGAHTLLAPSRLDSGWCQDLASFQGAWGHAGVRFSLVGVCLSCLPSFFVVFSFLFSSFLFSFFSLPVLLQILPVS